MKYTLIVGATGGIGSEVARLLNSENRNLILVGRDANKLDNLFDLLVSTGHKNNIKKIILDLSDNNSIYRLMEKLNDDQIEIDAFLYLAGVSIGSDIFSLSEKDWDYDMQINLKAPFLISQGLVHTMKKLNTGSMVFISSCSGFIGANKPNYGTSKMGVIGLMRSISTKGAKYGIRANCIVPGVVETPMVADWDAEKREKITAGVPIGKIAHPSEIANLISFLISDKSTYITGAVLNATGGLHI